MSDVVAKLFALLGQVLMTCHGSLPVQLPIGTLKQTATVWQNKRKALEILAFTTFFWNKKIHLGNPLWYQTNSSVQDFASLINAVSFCHLHVIFRWTKSKKQAKAKNPSLCVSHLQQYCCWGITRSDKKTSCFRGLESTRQWIYQCSAAEHCYHGYRCETRWKGTGYTGLIFLSIKVDTERRIL